MEYNISLRNLKVGRLYLAVNIDKWHPEFEITDVGRYISVEREDGSVFSEVYIDKYIFENGLYTISNGYRDAGGNLNESARFFEYSNNDDYLIARSEAEKLRPRAILRPREFNWGGGNRKSKRIILNKRYKRKSNKRKNSRFK